MQNYKLSLEPEHIGTLQAALDFCRVMTDDPEMMVKLRNLNGRIERQCNDQENYWAKGPQE